MSAQINRDHLLRYSGLCEYLLEDEWRDEFDKASLKRGQALFRRNAVGQIREVEGRRKPASTVTFGAEVQGGRLYQVTLECELLGRKPYEEWLISPRCSCPVFYSCKHCVAVFAKLKEIAQNPEGMSLGPLFAESPRDEALGEEVQDWLRGLTFAHQRGTTKPSKAASQKFLAYCIEEGDSGTPTLVLRPANWQSDNGFAIAEGTARTDTSTFPQYFSREDHLPALHYQNLYTKHWSPPELKGTLWAGILQSAAERGVLFENLGRPRSNYRRLSLGEPVEVLPDWEVLATGQSQPVLRFDRGSPRVLPTDPLLYLDSENNLLGPIQTDFPSEMIVAWTSGPSIANHHLKEISQVIGLISPTQSLPTPVEVKIVALPKSTSPKPILHIKVAGLGPQWSPRETIVAEVTMQYGDSPPWPPLKRAEKTAATWFTDETSYTVNRMRKEEAAHCKKLTKVGLRKLSTVYSRYEIPDDHFESYTLAELDSTGDLAWIEFLASAEPELKADGWTVIVDRDCGIHVDEISDFVSTLEQPPDHGIDWFEFDLSADLNGQKISLIPYIAQAIAEDLTNLPPEAIPQFLFLPHPENETGYIKLESASFLEICRSVEHLFQGPRHDGDGRVKLDRLGAADIANRLSLDDTATLQALAKLGKTLATITELPPAAVPKKLLADLRPYQTEGFRWLHFLASHQLNGVLADDMGLGKTVQTLAFLATLPSTKKSKPSLVVAPTSVITNWAAEVERFTPHLKALLLQGSHRADEFDQIPAANLVLTSYPLLNRDRETLLAQEWQAIILDEAQAIKNPKTHAAQVACQLKSEHRFCLSGTPMENHLGELWSLMNFVMPGFLGDQKSFTSQIRRPIERDRDHDIQRFLSRRVAPLILRRTKDEVAQDLPPKTEILHTVELSKKESDLYESVRATMDKRVRDALHAKGLAKSHIIILDALLKLRQICCHPQLLKNPTAQKLKEGSKMNFLTKKLLPELLEEKRRILLFSQFTSILSRIEEHLTQEGISHLKLTGQTKNRADLVKTFQNEDVPIFLISLKAGGTGLNLTAADTVIHYDPWWNPAAENQATDRAHRIGQVKPVFVHKLICKGSIEERILDLQRQKANLVKSLLSEETSKLKIDSETLSHLLSPLV